MKINFPKKTFDYLLLTGLSLLVCSFFIPSDRCIDIHLHDTYVLIAYRHIFWLMVLVLFLLWLLYTLLDKILYSKRLTKVHVWSTLLLIGLLVTLMFSEPLPGDKQDYSKYSNEGVQPSLSTISFETKVVMLSLLASMALQLLFPVNIALGLLKKIR